MKEAQVISKTVAHLINTEHFNIESVSIRTEIETEEFREVLQVENIPNEIIENINVNRNGIDISAYHTFGQGRIQKRLHIEAKGGSTFYNFYTMLGQFITMKNSPSSYYWFAFALPIDWRPKVKEYMMLDYEPKPIISDIIENYTNNGQGLYFYFVSNENVEKFTWKRLLR